MDSRNECNFLRRNYELRRRWHEAVAEGGHIRRELDGMCAKAAASEVQQFQSELRAKGAAVHQAQEVSARGGEPGQDQRRVLSEETPQEAETQILRKLTESQQRSVEMLRIQRINTV